MSETEVGYWQAIVDDQRVAAERKDEALAEARAEVARLREIVAAVAVHVQHVENRDARMVDTWETVKRLINEYLDSKNP